MQYMDLRDLTVIGRPSAIRKSFPRHHGVHYFLFPARGNWLAAIN